MQSSLQGNKDDMNVNVEVMQHVGDAVQAPRMQAAGLSQEDYIAEAYVKCAHIILGSRIFQPEQSRPPVDRRSGRWFLLEIEELGGLTQRLEPWRRDVYAPLIIQVSIQPWDTSTVMPGDSSSHQSGPFAGGGAHAASGSGMLLERWTLAFTAGVNSSSNSRAAMDTAAVYKRLILLIRSLYSTVRILPAYRMYRACKRHGSELFNTRYSLSTTADPSMQPLQHWPQHHQQQVTGLGMQTGGGSSSSSAGRMCHFAFTPVEALGGAFSIHVEYQPAATVHILEQTTIPVSMPRIISDYVDSPFARSAPNTADQAGRPSSGRAGSRLSGPEDPLALLRSSQLHHTPLVRHSWSSRDVSGPTVVQRGFSPVAAATSSHQQQQPQVLLHHQRTSSQGSAGLGVPLSPGAGGQSPVFGAAGGSSSRPPLPHTSSLHSAAQGSVAQGSRGASAGFSTSLPSGYSALMAGPGLPPASPGTPSTGLRSPLFRSSSLSTAAAIGAGGASAGAQQQGASRLGTSPVLLQQLRQQQQHPRPPVQPLSPQSTQQGFHVKPQEHNSSGQAASAGAAAAAAGGVSEGGELQQEQPQDCLAAVQQNQAAGHDGQGLGPSAVDTRGVGVTLIRPDTSISSQQHLPPMATGAAGAADAAAGVAGEPLSPDQVAGSKSSSSSSPEPDAGSSSSSSAVRAVSAPVTIPYKAKGVRARSVSDLVTLDAEAVVAASRQASTSGAHQQQQQEGRAGTVWPQQQQQEQEVGGLPTVAVSAVGGGVGPSAPTAINTRVAAAGGVAAGLSAAAAGGFKSSSSSGLLKVHQHHMAHQQQRQQQQLVQAPSSAPAAPRGMLGQLLSAGSGPTSPAFSPRSSAAHRGSSSRVVAAAMAAVAAATSTREAAYAAQYQAGSTADDPGAQSDSSSSSGTSSAADGIISSTPTPKGAIIIRPSPLIHVPPAAGSAGAPAAISSSPAGSSSCSSQPNSLGSRVLGRRMLAAQGFAGAGFGPYQPGLAVQPGTPTAPHSYLGSSPQLPFAFTPSGASLGTSLMSLADTQRQLVQSGAAPAASGSSSSSGGLKPHAAPLSRPGSAAAAAAAAAAISAAGAATAAPGAAAAEHLPGSTTAAGVGAGVCTVGSSSGGTAGLAMGTPSPPLLYPQTAASGGQVSFIRDISGLATIRRPSWSSRSSSFDIAAVGSATLPHHLSMSPGMADLMDPNLMLAYSSSHGSSAPGNALLRAAAGSSSHGAGSAAGGSSATGSGAPATVYRWNLGQQGAGGVQQPLQLQQTQQQPSSAPQQQQLLQAHTLGPGSSAAAAGVDVAEAGVSGDGAGGPEGVDTHVVLGAGAVAVDVDDAAGGAMLAGAAADEAFGASTGHDESESDLLPFVLDAEPVGLQHQQQLAGALGAAAAGVTGAGGGVGRCGPAGGAAAGYGEQGAGHGGGDAAGQRDVAVGAFLRLVQEAAAAPVGKLDRRQAVWQEQQRGQGEGEGEGGVQQGVAAPVCVGDAVQQVQELAAQLQQLLFPESFA